MILGLFFSTSTPFFCTPFLGPVTIDLCYAIHSAGGGVYILEHPADPGPPYPSIFQTEDLKNLLKATGVYKKA